MGRRRGHRDTQHVSLDTTHADKERAGCCLTALALLRCHWSLQAELPQLMERTSVVLADTIEMLKYAVL